MKTATAVRRDLTYATLPLPEPGFGEVLVAIKAVSLNYRDLLVAAGKYKHFAEDVILASDAAGEVAAIGEGVTRFAVGDRVAGNFFQGWFDGGFRREHGKTSLGGAIDGVLATARIFDQRGLVRIPSHLSFEEAATLPCAAVTAWHALQPTQPGDTVLILGTGGVALFGLQFAKLRGARVIITSSSDEKLAKAVALGAHGTINYRTHPDWENEVLRLTDGRGADNVLELGGAGTMSHSLAAVRPGGQVSVIGIVTGTVEPLNIASILPNVRLQGIYVGSVAMFEEMNRAIELNQLRPVIDRVFTFREAPEALRHLEAAQHFGKVVITTR